jgi:hypothetical protein
MYLKSITCNCVIRLISDMYKRDCARNFTIMHLNLVLLNTEFGMKIECSFWAVIGSP